MVCFLGAIILMDCILILKVRRQPSPSDCNDTPAMPGYRHFLYWLSGYYFIKVPAFISSMEALYCSFTSAGTISATAPAERAPFSRVP